MKIVKKYQKSEYLTPLYNENKKGFEMGFNWLFAIIAGGFILFLAIFASGKMVSVGTVTANTLNAKNFVTILETWEAGLAAGVKPPELKFKTETILYFGCSEDINSPFGVGGVSASNKGITGNYTQKGFDVAIKNKYIFTDNQLSGKTFYPFSVGFFMPFKVADLIIFSDRLYCFYDAPTNFEEDVKQLQMNNVMFPNKTQVCKGVKVCFSSNPNCDILVSTPGKYVLKDGQRLYYQGNLIYAAIFSSPEIYKCNVKRLTNKFYQLAYIYAEKIKLIERKKCKSNVGEKLYQMAGIAGNFTFSEANLKNLMKLSDEIDSINDQADPGCKLYKNEEKNEY